MVNPEKTERNGGVAFKLTRPTALAETDDSESLVIFVATDEALKRNYTVTHEFFHLITNSINNINNRWCFEGMPVWSVDAMRKVDHKIARWEEVNWLLSTEEGNKKLDKMIYSGAIFLWNPLGYLCKKAQIKMPTDDIMLQATFIDSMPMLEDYIFSGAPLMKDIMERIHAKEPMIFKEQGYQSW